MLHKKGFTLIEMVVSLGVITAVTTLFIANYQSSNKRSDLVMTAQKLVADLHSAQSSTLGLSKYNDAVPAGGWGVSFDKQNNVYTIFADLDAPGRLGYMQYDPSTEGVVSYGARQVTLPSRIRLEELKITSSLTTSLANVTFLPPDPRTNIWVSGGATSTTLSIKLLDTSTNQFKTVKVNFLGLVEVID